MTWQTGDDVSDQHHEQRRRARRDRNSLLSTFSILLLSGFLIGNVSWRFVSGGLQSDPMAFGIIGLLSFVGLDHVKMWRRRRAQVAEQRYIEGRLERHVDRCAPESLSNPGECDSQEVAAAELQPVH